MLFDAVANVPHINTEEFEAMMTSSMEVSVGARPDRSSLRPLLYVTSARSNVCFSKDLLTVVYLASLSRSQLALGEKLTSILA